MSTKRKIRMFRPSRDAVGWVVAIALAAALQVWLHLKTTEVAYELGSLRGLFERLAAEKRDLDLELASWTTPSALDAMARNRLGMQSPSAGQVVALP